MECKVQVAYAPTGWNLARLHQAEQKAEEEKTLQSILTGANCPVDHQGQSLLAQSSVSGGAGP